jgi:xanthine dioxygenase
VVLAVLSGCSRLLFTQLWKNPVTGGLHFQVHPCGVAELLVDPLPVGANREGALFPDGAHITNLKEARELLYKMQRPAIAPNVSHNAELAQNY